jgi:hypothetical protein
MSRSRNSRNRPRSTPAAEVVRATAGDPQSYSFAWKGKRYTLPPAADSAEHLKAGEVIDAIMNGDDTSNIRLGLMHLTVAKLPPGAMDALRDMPIVTFSEHVLRWMESTGVAPGESERSSS